jgi:hypothetical protein
LEFNPQVFISIKGDDNLIPTTFKLDQPRFGHAWNCSLFIQRRGEFHLAPNFPLENVAEQKKWNAGRRSFIE